jgi:hypothetical protein
MTTHSIVQQAVAKALEYVVALGPAIVAAFKKTGGDAAKTSRLIYRAIESEQFEQWEKKGGRRPGGDDDDTPPHGTRGNP